METTFVALVAYAVFLLSAQFGAKAILLQHYGWDDISPAKFRSLAMKGHWYGGSLIIASAPTLAVLWLAIRKAGREFNEYLALNWPRANELLLAFAITAAVVAVEYQLLSTPPLNSPPIVGGPGGLFMLLLGVCVAGPILEEFVFRGFMFRGWSESFLGPIGAILLTSALFGAYHFQYDWSLRLWIFLHGIILGTFRWRTNSTWLAVMIHSGINTHVMFNLEYV